MTEQEKIIANFAKLNTIPRKSGDDKQKAVADYLVEWAKKNSFDHRFDHYGNLLVIVGKENADKKATVVQSHMDMHIWIWFM